MYYYVLSEPDIWDLTKIAIPKIKSEWKDVALSMGYSFRAVKAIEIESKDLKECCQSLFSDWLETDHGPTPKSWLTLLSKIREVDVLATAVEEIEMELLRLVYTICPS